MLLQQARLGVTVQQYAFFMQQVGSATVGSTGSNCLDDDIGEKKNRATAHPQLN